MSTFRDHLLRWQHTSDLAQELLLDRSLQGAVTYQDFRSHLLAEGADALTMRWLSAMNTEHEAAQR